MSNQPDGSRANGQVDSAGNTTKALTKDMRLDRLFAGGVCCSRLIWKRSRRVTDKVHLGGYMPPGWSFTNINLAQVPVFVGALLGAMLTYLFSSMAIKAVGRTAQMVVQDVRDQFKENPGIMAGTSKPDYGRCVRIVTGAALKEMVLPGALVVVMPVAVGLIFRFQFEPSERGLYVRERFFRCRRLPVRR
jgi:K(+)-stimulated pyrophosphate-energized sodium pump